MVVAKKDQMPSEQSREKLRDLRIKAMAREQEELDTTQTQFTSQQVIIKYDTQDAVRYYLYSDFYTYIIHIIHILYFLKCLWNSGTNYLRYYGVAYGQLLLGHPVYLDTDGEKNCISSGKWYWYSLAINKSP